MSLNTKLGAYWYAIAGYALLLLSFYRSEPAQSSDCAGYGTRCARKSVSGLGTDFKQRVACETVEHPERLRLDPGTYWCSCRRSADAMDGTLGVQ